MAINMLLTKNIRVVLIMMAALGGTTACVKEEPQDRIPVVSFEGSQIAINVDENDAYELTVRLSSTAPKDFSVKLDLSGTAIENEHYSVTSKELAIAKGANEAVFPIHILSEQIWVEELTLRVLIAPGMDYAVDPNLSSQILIKLTKEIVLPQIAFATIDHIHTNPFYGDTILLQLLASEVLFQDAALTLEAESVLAIGDDFLINGGISNSLIFPKGVAAHEVSITILKKDQAGIKHDLKLSLKTGGQPTAVIDEAKSSVVLEVHDPLVDLSPLFRSGALLGGLGYRVGQAIKTTDSSWSGNVVINSSANNERNNYLRSHRNMAYIAGFNCIANTSGGDVLRLSDLLWFASDTTIADFGTGSTTRFFTPTDSLLRFIADGSDHTKGLVTSPRQLFTAKLVLRADWESGSNPNRPWQHESRATNGLIENSTIPTFHTMEVWLERLEGTFDFNATEPEVIFDAWFKSNSPYFMRNPPENLDIVREGDLYKVTYRLFPRL